MTAPDINLYDVLEAKVLPHEVIIDQNGEYSAISRVSGHVVKFPADCNLAELADAHNRENANQVMLNVDGDGNIIPTEEQNLAIQQAVETTANASQMVENLQNGAPVDQPPVEEVQPVTLEPVAPVTEPVTTPEVPVEAPVEGAFTPVE